MQHLQLDDRLIFPALNLVTRDQLKVHIEPKVMAVLLELAKRPGEVVSKAQLIDTVWSGMFVCEEVVTNAISLLRRALGDDAKSASLIQTIPKRGYRLLSAVTNDGSGPNSAEPSIGERAVAFSGNHPSNLEKAVLRVRHLRQEETISSLNTACAYCEEIIRQEPKCAAAYAELALVVFLLEKRGAVARKDSELKVRAAVDKALCLDERTSATLVCLAKLEYRYNWAWERSEQHFREAIRRNPLDADAFTEFSILLSVTRRFDESLRNIETACQLDPFSPSVRLQAGHANYASGNWAAAAGHYYRLLRSTPEHMFARWGLADALVRNGNVRAAMRILNEGLSSKESTAHPLLVTSLFRAEALVKPSKRNRLRSHLLQQKTDDAILLAELYGSVGRMTDAFAQLNQAADMRHYRLLAAHMFPQFEVVREDPRYGKLLKRVGLSI